MKIDGIVAFGALSVFLFVFAGLIVIGLTDHDPINPPNPWELDRNVSINGDLNVRTFQLTESVIDDLRISAELIRTQGVSNTPSYDSFIGGTYAVAFDPNTLEQGYFSAQFPHTRAHDTNVNLHFHWAPETTNIGDVNWCVEYTWANIGDVFPNPTSTVCVLDSSDGNAFKHHMTPQIVLDGNGKRFSSMLIARIWRAAATGGDTYTGDAFLLELDIHYYIDKLGENFST